MGNTSLKGIRIALYIFTILMALDLASTLLLGKLTKYLEANILYKYIGIPGILATTALLIAVQYWMYKRSTNPVTRFALINTIITVCVFKLLVINQNINIYLHPPTLIEAMSITQEQKVATVVNLWWTALIPYLCGLFSFWFFQKDHVVLIKK